MASIVDAVQNTCIITRKSATLLQFLIQRYMHFRDNKLFQEAIQDDIRTGRALRLNDQQNVFTPALTQDNADTGYMLDINGYFDRAAGNPIAQLDAADNTGTTNLKVALMYFQYQYNQPYSSYSLLGTSGQKIDIPVIGVELVSVLQDRANSASQIKSFVEWVHYAPAPIAGMPVDYSVNPGMREVCTSTASGGDGMPLYNQIINNTDHTTYQYIDNVVLAINANTVITDPAQMAYIKAVMADAFDKTISRIRLSDTTDRQYALILSCAIEEAINACLMYYPLHALLPSIGTGYRNCGLFQRKRGEYDKTPVRAFLIEFWKQPVVAAGQVPVQYRDPFVSRTTGKIYTGRDIADYAAAGLIRGYINTLGPATIAAINQYYALYVLADIYQLKTKDVNIVYIPTLRRLFDYALPYSPMERFITTDADMKAYCDYILAGIDVFAGDPPAVKTAKRNLLAWEMLDFTDLLAIDPSPASIVKTQYDQATIALWIDANKTQLNNGSGFIPSKWPWFPFGQSDYYYGYRLKILFDYRRPESKKIKDYITFATILSYSPNVMNDEVAYYTTYTDPARVRLLYQLANDIPDAPYQVYNAELIVKVGISGFSECDGEASCRLQNYPYRIAWELQWFAMMPFRGQNFPIRHADQTYMALFNTSNFTVKPYNNIPEKSAVNIKPLYTYIATNAYAALVNFPLVQYTAYDIAGNGVNLNYQPPTKVHALYALLYNIDQLCKLYELTANYAERANIKAFIQQVIADDILSKYQAKGRKKYVEMAMCIAYILANQYINNTYWENYLGLQLNLLPMNSIYELLMYFVMQRTRHRNLDYKAWDALTRVTSLIAKYQSEPLATTKLVKVARVPVNYTPAECSTVILNKMKLSDYTVNQRLMHTMQYYKVYGKIIHLKELMRDQVGVDLSLYKHNISSAYSIQLYEEAFAYYKTTVIYYYRLKNTNLQRYMDLVKRVDPGTGALLDLQQLTTEFQGHFFNEDISSYMYYTSANQVGGLVYYFQNNKLVVVFNEIDKYDFLWKDNTDPFVLQKRGSIYLHPFLYILDYQIYIKLDWVASLANASHIVFNGLDPQYRVSTVAGMLHAVACIYFFNPISVAYFDSLVVRQNLNDLSTTAGLLKDSLERLSLYTIPNRAFNSFQYALRMSGGYFDTYRTRLLPAGMNLYDKAAMRALDASGNNRYNEMFYHLSEYTGADIRTELISQDPTAIDINYGYVYLVMAARLVQLVLYKDMIAVLAVLIGLNFNGTPQNIALLNEIMDSDGGVTDPATRDCYTSRRIELPLYIHKVRQLGIDINTPNSVSANAAALQAVLDEITDMNNAQNQEIIAGLWYVTGDFIWANKHGYGFRFRRAIP